MLIKHPENSILIHSIKIVTQFVQDFLTSPELKKVIYSSKIGISINGLNNEFLPNYRESNIEAYLRSEGLC